MGLEPTTFCMATRPGLPHGSASFRRNATFTASSRSTDATRRTRAARYGDVMVAGLVADSYCSGVPAANACASLPASSPRSR